jgi:hypothetical protein
MIRRTPANSKCSFSQVLLALCLSSCIDSGKGDGATHPAFCPSRHSNIRQSGGGVAICMAAEGGVGKRIAVVGAGAAGLAVAKELRSIGHDVTVLEQGDLARIVESRCFIRSSP